MLTAIKANSKHQEFRACAVALFSAALSCNAVAGPIHDLGAVEVISKCLAAPSDDASYKVWKFVSLIPTLCVQENCINALALLAPKMKSFDEYSNAGGHTGLIDALNKSGANHTSLVTSGLNLFVRLLEVPGALDELRKGDTVDAVLSAMLLHQNVQDVQFTGTAILEAIATEDDVKRCLANLDRCISGARSDPNKAYKSLAAVNGLSQVSRLRDIFEQKKAAESIQKGIASWIEGAQFSDQQKIIKAAARSIESLKIGATTPLDATISSLLHTCLIPQVKTLIDKQESKDNSLLDLIACCHGLCGQSRITPESLPAVLESVMKVSWKYQEIRKVQVECLEMMTELAMMSNGEGVKILSESGALKNVISYMQKVMIYKDVQAAGLQLLGTILKQDPSTVEPIKFAGGIELCKSIRAAHSASTEIRLLLAPVASALMPADFLDADIKKAIESTNHGIMDGDIQMTTDALANLNGLTTTADGSRSAVHNRISLSLQDVVGFVSNKKPAEVAELVSESSKLIKNICETRPGVTHIARCGGVEMLGSMLNTLANESVPDSPVKREGKNNMEETSHLCTYQASRQPFALCVA